MNGRFQTGDLFVILGVHVGKDSIFPLQKASAMRVETREGLITYGGHFFRYVDFLLNHLGAT